MRRALPLVGQLPSFLWDKLGFLTAAAEGGAECATRLQLGGVTYLLNSPEEVCHVLTRNAENYAKSPRLAGSNSTPLFGDVLFTMNATGHRQRRLVMQDVLSRCRVESIAAITTTQVDSLVAGWRAKRRIEIESSIVELVERISASIVFGPATALAHPEIRTFALARRAYVEHRLQYPITFLEGLPLPVVVRYHRARRRLLG